MKKLLLHCCCGPCAVYPISQLKEKMDITAFFYNHNIHPFKEFKKRLTTLETYLKDITVPLVANRDYELQRFLRDAVFNEESRCRSCYSVRLKECAEYAREHDFDAFSSTLLYSKYQNHSLIISQGKKLEKEYGIEFYYSDFRIGWQDGIDESIAREMYRQPYCGCIYSEQERYDKHFKKGKNK